MFRRLEREIGQRAAAWLRLGLLATSLAGCLGASQPAAVALRRTAVMVDAAPVLLNPANPSQAEVGEFRYAGGVVLTSSQTDQLHGLSDLVVDGSGRLVSVGDLGVLLEARLRLDEAGRLIGVSDATIAPLTDPAGRTLIDKTEADAEGLAVLPSGDRLVSFERRHRIWLYPAGGGPPQPVPSPGEPFEANGGMEALAADPLVASDAYLVGGEDSGKTWTCRVSTACAESVAVDKPADFGLVALTRVPGGMTAYLLRAFDDARGNRISLQLFRGDTAVAQMDLARPFTVDNFEALAAVPLADGGIRFYLLSDDNGSASQRTLLLAFDWQRP